MALRILHWTCRIFLAAVFLYSGYIKIQSPFQFAVAVSGYQLMPENMIWPIANYFPWAEVALGVLLLLGWKIRYVAGAAAGLLLFFTVILSITYMRGIEANCGCFSFDDRITPFTILRDSLLLLPAIFLIFERRRPSLSDSPDGPPVQAAPHM